MTDKAISPLRQRMIEDMEVRGFTACTQRGYPLETGCRKIDTIHESIYETDRILRADIVVNRFRQKQELGSICT